MYTTNLKTADTDPKAATWAALCCLLAAQRVNLARTVTAAIIGQTETKNSWEVCRQRAMELAAKALAMLASDFRGQSLAQEILKRAQEISQSPARGIPIQRYASVWGDSILDIEHEAIMRSGVSIDELNDFVESIPWHQWLLP